MTHLVAFDLDGTLVDTPTAIVRTFTAAFAAMDAPACDPAAIRATIGLPLQRAFGSLMGIAPEDARVAEAVRQYQIAFRELVLPEAARLVFPGVAAGLEALRDSGYTLAVATSKFNTSAETLLKAAGLREAFTMVVGADQVTHPKPHPEMGEFIMRTLGFGADRAFMVGDTTHDLLMAKAAGMRSIAVTYGVHSVAQLSTADPTWLADTFEDVITSVKIGSTEQ